jgi:hypothetical protein
VLDVLLPRFFFAQTEILKSFANGQITVGGAHRHALLALQLRSGVIVVSLIRTVVLYLSLILGPHVKLEKVSLSGDLKYRRHVR